MLICLKTNPPKRTQLPLIPSQEFFTQQGRFILIIEEAGSHHHTQTNDHNFHLFDFFFFFCICCCFKIIYSPLKRSYPFFPFHMKIVIRSQISSPSGYSLFFPLLKSCDVKNKLFWQLPSQWLRLHVPNAGSPGLISGQGTRYMIQLRIGMQDLKVLHTSWKLKTPSPATRTWHSQINKYFLKTIN